MLESELKNARFYFFFCNFYFVDVVNFTTAVLFYLSAFILQCCHYNNIIYVCHCIQNTDTKKNTQLKL